MLTTSTKYLKAKTETSFASTAEALQLVVVCSQYADATNNVHRITITQYPETATVEDLPPMNFERAFANSVVAPDGKVYVFGGQARTVVSPSPEGLQTVTVVQHCSTRTGSGEEGSALRRRSR